MPRPRLAAERARSVWIEKQAAETGTRELRGRQARPCLRRRHPALQRGRAAGAQVSNGVPTGPPSPAAPAPAAAPAAPQQTQGPPKAPAPANPNQAGTPAGATPAANLAKAKPEPAVPALKANLGEFAGKTVENIQYEGVDFDKSDKLLSELSQKAGQPLDPDKVRQTTRRLFQTGRYRNIAVRVEPAGSNGLTLIFSGIARYYVGRVQINGIQEDRLTSLVEYGTQLNPGTAYTNSLVTTATGLVKQVLAQAGYYEPTIAVKTDRDDAGQQVNVTYTIDVGKQARVGAVTLIGKDPGITEAEFRKKGKLKPKTRVGRETTSTALGNMRTFFQKKDRLEAVVTLQKSTYDPATKTVNYAFNVDQGPIVLVKTEGYKFSKSRLHLLVPVYEEGAVDVDLLNEGSFNIHDFLQQEGYFDAKVNVAQVGKGQVATDTAKPDTFTISQPGGAVPRTTLPPPPPPAPNEFKPINGTETVLYTIDKGEKHKVQSVRVVGSKYFSAELLEEGLSVKKGDAYQRSGRYSAQLVIGDKNKIQSLYRANGFNDAKVTSDVKDAETGKNGKQAKVGEISVVYTVVEGAQQQFGAVSITGADPARIAKLTPLLQATPGQPFSLVTLSGDRDELRSYYVSNGFDQARVEVAQVIDKANPTRTDVAFNITEGEQVFIGKVLESGVEHTRQALVNAQTEVAAGQPLDQSALLNTQRKLYDLALFNEVVAAVQNPTGDAELKNVLLQITEAKRWDVTYGFGFRGPDRHPHLHHLHPAGHHQGPGRPGRRQPPRHARHQPHQPFRHPGFACAPHHVRSARKGSHPHLYQPAPVRLGQVLAANLRRLFQRAGHHHLQVLHAPAATCASPTRPPAKTPSSITSSTAASRSTPTRSPSPPTSSPSCLSPCGSQAPASPGSTTPARPRRSTPSRASTPACSSSSPPPR